MAAIAALKAQGDAYCWRGCGTWLVADVPRGHPQHMTLGHIIAWDDNPDMFWDPSNHAPECGPCNYADGARRTNAKRAAQQAQTQTPTVRSSGRW